MSAARQVKSVLDVKRTGLTHNINEMKRAFELLARMVADKGLKVIFKGTTCATDHKTIYLPELALLERKGMTVKEVEEAQGFLNALRGFLFHEVAHVLHTDNAAFVKAAKESMLLKHAVNAVEDVRIEQKMADVWRGAGVSLRQMNEWMLRKMQKQIEKEPIVGKVIVGIAWVARTGQDHWFFKELDAPTKALLKKFAPEMRAARNLESTDEAVRLGRRIIKKLEEMSKQEQEESGQGQPQKGGKKQKMKGPALDVADPEEEEEEEEEGDDEEEHANNEEGDEDEEEDAEGGAGEDGDESDEDDESDADGGGEDDEGGDEETSEGDAGAGDEDDGDGEGGEDEDGGSSGGADGGSDEDDGDLGKALDQLKDELEDPEGTANEVDQMLDKGRQLGSFITPPGNNDKYLVYTTEYDKADPAVERPPTEYKAMMEQAREHFGVLKRNLGNLLKARAHVMTITELEEGELDSSMLYRLANGTSDKVFKEDFEHLDTNVGVVLLVNESGSMDGWAGNGMTRIALARITAALMGEVLDSLGIAFGCYGHTTGVNASAVFHDASSQDQETFTRWGATQIYVYKDFDESFAVAKHRIPSMAARNNTHDAEALIFAANKLLSQKELKRRIIMTIDDGRPEPNQPAAWRYDPQGGNAVTQNAQRNVQQMSQKHQDYVREVTKTLDALGVEVLGMGMATDDVKFFYDKWLAVQDVGSFPAVALKELRKLLMATPKK